VLLNVLPNAGVDPAGLVGLVGVRAVVVGLVDAVATDEIAIGGPVPGII
jgi:hypothetical protein